MKTRFLLTLAASFFIAWTLHAAGISKEKLLEMSTAKLDPEIIGNMLEAQGVDFAVTPDSLLELARAGVDSRVLSVLSKVALPKAGQVPSAYRAAADLYRAGKYAEAVDTLESHLSSEPEDHVSRALLATTYLRLHKRDLSLQQLDRLKAGAADSKAAAAAALVRDLLSAYDSQVRLNDELKSALLQLRVDEAVRVIDRMKLDELHRQVLLVHIDLYRGDFAGARAALAKLMPTKFSDRTRIDDLKSGVDKWEQSFVTARKQIDDALYSGVAPSTWTGTGGPGQSSHFVEDYLKSIDTAMALCPLQSEMMDISFHAGLITLDYQRLEALGDSILKVAGVLRVPAYAKDRYLFLAMDEKNHRIRAEDDARHHFLVKGDIRGNNLTGWRPKEETTSRWIAPLEPFDLAWDEITAIEQKANGHSVVMGGNALIGGYSGGAKALQFSPHGVLPEWSMMNAIHYLYGERAQKECTLKLGKYILHLLNRSNVTAKLVDPSKVKSGNGGLIVAAAFAGALSGAGAHYGNAGLTQLGSQTLQDVQAAAAQQSAERQATEQRGQAWSVALQERSMRLWEEDVFADIEKLLQLVN